MKKVTFLVALASLFAISLPVDARNLVVLYQFSGGQDGSGPSGGLTRLNKGTFIGTTVAGGTSNVGTAFLLTQEIGSGGWSKSTIWSFGSGQDGQAPQGGLIQDSRGNVYGTTLRGGEFNKGTLFRLSPPTASGRLWTETRLWDFGGASDGSAPSPTVVISGTGTIFGATYEGGSSGMGTLYAIYPDPTATKGYKESVIWDFTGTEDGMAPTSIVMNQFGALIGTASEGGHFGYGDVFVLQPSPGYKKSGTMTTVWSFSGTSDGGFPTNLASDFAGSYYETLTVGTNQNSSGSVFKLSYQNTKWVGTPVLNFPGGAGGSGPSTVVALSKNVLIGTTANGGAEACLQGHIQVQCGVAFSLIGAAKGYAHWNENVLWDFSPSPAPQGVSGPIVPDEFGGYFGETTSGGALGSGTLFYIHK